MTVKSSIWRGWGSGRILLGFRFYFSWKEGFIRTFGKFCESKVFAVQEKAFRVFGKLLAFGLQHANSCLIWHFGSTLAQQLMTI